MAVIRPRIAARLDPSLHASVADLVSLRYASGADPQRDLPAHVRAASALRRSGNRLVTVQDHVNAIAILLDNEVLPLLLPRGPGGRRMFDDDIGNKSDKMDLEALAALPDGRLVAFGSGASAMREKVVVISATQPPAVHDAQDLYRSLRSEPAFAGSELNIEGAVVHDDRLLLFQRGNGSSTGPQRPVNAVGVVDLERFLRWLDGGASAPVLVAVSTFDLGAVKGSPLSFTDAAVTDDGRIAVIACAEDSPDALTDGPVLGCRFGYLERDGTLRMTDILESGGPSRLKLEGIESRPDVPHQFDVVADPDRPNEPALLGRLTVRE